MASIVKIAIAQINCVVGDLAGNTNKILGYCERARTAGADVMLTPELALCGYPPEDLLLREGCYPDCNAALERLAREVSGITLVVGHPHEDQGKGHNAASVVKTGVSWRPITSTSCRTTPCSTRNATSCPATFRASFKLE